MTTAYHVVSPRVSLTALLEMIKRTSKESPMSKVAQRIFDKRTAKNFPKKISDLRPFTGENGTILNFGILISGVTSFKGAYSALLSHLIAAEFPDKEISESDLVSLVKNGTIKPYVGYLASAYLASIRAGSRMKADKRAEKNRLRTSYGDSKLFSIGFIESVKDMSVSDAVVAIMAASAPGKRGRPKKAVHEKTVEPIAIKRGRGRPRKDDAYMSITTDLELCLKTDGPITKAKRKEFLAMCTEWNRIKQVIQACDERLHAFAKEHGITMPT
jgi:hypothetical protein